jgi:hypothetical protein
MIEMIRMRYIHSRPVKRRWAGQAKTVGEQRG